jgi:hypothetical protein
MRLSGRLLTAAAAMAMGSSAALAADIVIVPPPPAPIPVIIEDPAFTGPYWGVYGGIWNSQFQRLPQIQPMVGTQFGYNFAANSLRFGFEIETEYYRFGNPATVDATANGRIGLVLGSNILLYGQAGIGSFNNNPVWSAGGGIELALGGGNLALFAEGKAMFLLGGGGGGPVAWSIRGGVNYYADENNLDATGNFDWGGLYFGAHGGIINGGGPIAGNAGVQVGYNFGGGPFVGGIEVETTHSFGPPVLINAALNGRGGFAFGNVLIYGEAGLASLVALPVWTAGGGLELALGTQLGVFGEAKAVFPLGGGPAGFQVNGGMNIHFGR